MLVHPQVVKTTFPTNNLLENNRLESFKPSDKDVNASSEKQESCIFLSSTGKCAVPSCDSRDDSLMLLKVSDNSYVGICGHHAFTEGSGDGLRQLGAIDVQPLAAVNVQTEYDVKTLHLVTPGSTDVDQRGTDNQEALITTAENDTSDAHAVIHQTDDMVTTINSGHVDTTSCHHTTSCHTDTPSCHHTTTSDTTNQAENSKMTPGVVSSVEEFPTILELDAEGENLPGHIVDESFSMAQLEVLCPLCDEQFFCMADYVTHLESCHN
ncbi:uncharacterized protein LOC121878982 [Homarus americanus]|uniref:uncharacterized protein LOC121878982 n=1 Tax=Homarus americanus TaxID=6706 RepID=UPI001C4583F9|nr:uncharacterized protein LOC121878982 [Homarus americanus]